MYLSTFMGNSWTEGQEEERIQNSEPVSPALSETRAGSLFALGPS